MNASLAAFRINTEWSVLKALVGRLPRCSRRGDAALALAKTSARAWHLRAARVIPSHCSCSFFSFLFSFFSCVLPSSSEGFGVAEKIVLLTFISAVILMAILGNLLVMVAVCRDRQLR